jgi:hypothetical protein
VHQRRFETDTALATYLFTVIDRAVVTEAVAFRQLNPRFRGVHLKEARHTIRAAKADEKDAECNSRPNFRPHCRIVSYVTEMPRAASISSTIRRLTGNHSPPERPPSNA